MPETQLASMFIGSADDGDDIDRGRPSDAGNMIHIINPQTGEILDYITLDNIIEDTHKKSLESYIETYDAIVLCGDGFSYDQYLEKRNHIIIPDEDGTYQEFILFEVDKYRDTEGRKTHFYAHATYLELKKAKVIYPTRREGLTLSQHAGWALNDTGWTVGIVEAEGTRTFTIENHTNPYEFLKRIANEFDVELRFRVEHDGRRITARYVDFLERIGDWKGREVEFGKDLDSIRRVEKQDIVTALLGLGPERDDGTRIEVLVTDEEALQRWGRVDEHGNLHHLIEPYEIQSDRQEMTEEEARQYTRTALNKRINTQVTYETTILDLEEVPGLEHEKIRFGDTIRIKDTYFNPPLYLEARVYEIERSIKNKAKKDIKLGDYIEYTEEEVHAIWRQLRNQIRRRITAAQLVEYAEPKKVESNTPPPINSEGDNPIWVDTSQEPYIPYVADVENNEWVRMTLSDDDVLVNEVNYNGLKWSKDEGLIVERSDGKVRSILNGTDGIKVQQKDVNDNWVDVFFVDSQGNVKFAGHLEGASGSFTGTVNANAGHFGDNLSLVDGKLRITRPDGAVWMQDGYVHQDYSISGYDPHFMQTYSLPTIDSIYPAWDIYGIAHSLGTGSGFYTQYNGILDGRGVDHIPGSFDDIRDPSKSYTIRFQRYELIHSARFLVFVYQIANNSRVKKHRVMFDEVTPVPSGANPINTVIDYEEGDRGIKNIVIDLGVPTYEVRRFDFRVGWLREWCDKHDITRFRIPRLFLTDTID